MYYFGLYDDYVKHKHSSEEFALELKKHRDPTLGDIEPTDIDVKPRFIHIVNPVTKKNLMGYISNVKKPLQDCAGIREGRVNSPVDCGCS